MIGGGTSGYFLESSTSTGTDVLCKQPTVKTIMAAIEEFILPPEADIEGWLWKEGEKNLNLSTGNNSNAFVPLVPTWRRRWFVVEGDEIAYYKTDVSRFFLSVAFSFEVLNSNRQSATNKGRSLLLISPQSQILLALTSIMGGSSLSS